MSPPAAIYVALGVEAAEWKRRGLINFHKALADARGGRGSQALAAHRDAQAKVKLDAIYWEDHGYVFATRTGRPTTHRNAHRSWSRILQRADVEHRGMHHLRHTWITTLAELGVRERTAQQLAGHADGRMTREIYTHVTDIMLREAADAIERVVTDVRGSPTAPDPEERRRPGAVNGS